MTSKPLFARIDGWIRQDSDDNSLFGRTFPYVAIILFVAIYVAPLAYIVGCLL